MNSTKIIKGSLVALTLSLAMSLPVMAQNGTASSTRPRPHQAANSAASTARMASEQAKATKLIDQRVASLTALVTKVQGLRNVSDSQKGGINTTIQSVITNLQNLKAKIETDASSTQLQTDTKSITAAYRVYALVVPQINVIAAADRVVTVGAMLNNVGAKLQTRLTEAGTVPNATTIQGYLTDMVAKINDAQSQAQAAVTEASALVPDQGDKTIMASNTASLKNARSKIQVANKDLTAAQKDAQLITQALKKIKPAKTTGTLPVTSASPSTMPTTTPVPAGSTTN